MGVISGLVSWFLSDPGRLGVADGLGTFRFGGTPFGALGDPSGRFRLGDCFSPGEPVDVGFSPGPVGGPPSVPAGFTVGEAPGVPAGLAPSRFGGTGFFAAAAAFGEAPGVTFAFGELAPGFTKLGGVFGPATVAGEPVAPGVPVTFPLLPICGFTKGVGFGRSFGGGFCSAMVFLSFSAS